MIIGLSFTSSIGTCGAFTYTCTDNAGNPINTSIFTFFSAGPSIRVQTNLVAHVSTYNLKVIGTLGSWGSVTILVTVIIELGCADTTITPNTITTKTYQITDPALTYTFSDWTSSVTGCGAFTYASTLSDNSALDSNYITFTAASK